MILFITLGVLLLIFTARARPAQWHPNAVWLKQALCVHRHEAAWNDPDPPYYGGMQFLLSTWHRAGGHGYPNLASPREQLYRAWRIWRMNGGAWNEWPTYRTYCA